MTDKPSSLQQSQLSQAPSTYESFVSANEYVDNSLFGSGPLFPSPPSQAPIKSAPVAATTTTSTSAPPPRPAPEPAPSGSVVFETFVDDPQKVGGTLKGHVSYRVNTRQKNLPGYRSGTVVVRRRFSDFVWLSHRLQETYPGVLVPPLPEKKLVLDQYNAEFVEERRRYLEVFLQRVTKHPVLHLSKTLQIFLTATDEEFAAAMAATRFKPDPRDMLNSITSLFRKKEVSSDIRVNETNTYATEWGYKLDRVATAVKEVASRRKELSSDLSRLASALLALGERESVAMRSGLQALAGGVQRESEQTHAMAEHEMNRFRDVIRDQSRISGAVEDMIRSRASLVDKYSQTTAELEADRQTLHKLTSRGDPKAQAMSVRVSEVEHRAIQLKEEVNKATESCVVETQRFHAEKFAALRGCLTELVQARVESLQQELLQYQALLPVMQEMEYQKK